MSFQGQAFHIDRLTEQNATSGTLYHEFLRVQSMSMGVYQLPAGGTDPQQPHTEDEAYYVVSGKGKIRVGDEIYPVEAGSVIFVAAHVEHKFHDIEQDLTILVFFAPHEYANR